MFKKRKGNRETKKECKKKSLMTTVFPFDDDNPDDLHNDGD